MSAEQADRIEFDLTIIKNLLKRQENAHIPTAYLNGLEVMRQLNITRPTLIQLVKDGIITAHNEDINRYLLSEIIWLKGEKYKNLSIEEVEKLKQRKEKEFNHKK